MATALFISHPEVEVDPDVPIGRWHLSNAGICRMRVFSELPVVKSVDVVWASRETKAIEAAEILAAQLGLRVRVHLGLGENDRTATGFLPPAEFEGVADAFFARPSESIRGWERAVDAQARIVDAVEEILSLAPEGDIALVAHGGVGTLLLCQYLGLSISRKLDQPFQGHYWAFDIVTRSVLHPWRPIAPR